MIDDIIENVEKYLDLRRFKDPEFAGYVQKLHAWQQQRMSETYWVLSTSEPEASQIDYFLNDIYCGFEMRHLANKLTTTAKLIDKLFSNLDLIHMAMEFNSITGQLDDTLASYLFETMGVDEINEEDYATAFKAIELNDLRERQLVLLLGFAKEADIILQDKVVYRTFKVAKLPAKVGGLGSLYAILDKGFDVMRKGPDTYDMLQDLVNHERKIYQRIYAETGPFFKVYSSEVDVFAEDAFDEEAIHDQALHGKSGAKPKSKKRKTSIFKKLIMKKGLFWRASRST